MAGIHGHALGRLISAVGTRNDRLFNHIRAAFAVWLITIRRYIIVSACGNLVWEFTQLPLYTIWRQGTPAENIFAALHCTGGDILIATCSSIAALLMVSRRDWPARGYVVVAGLAIAFGFSYTIYSEWLHTEVRGSWTYSDLMPRLPLIGTGLSPLMQWLAVPAAAFWSARYRLLGYDTM